MNCPNCNKVIPEDAVECRHCGLIIEKWKARAMQPPPASSVGSARSRGMGPAIALLVCAALGGAAWHWATRPAPRPSEGPQTETREKARGPIAAQSGAGNAQEAEIEWVAMPGGAFTMGRGYGGDDEHHVTIKPFEMAKTLVTNEQYLACVGAGACTANQDYGADFNRYDQPVVGVTWEQARVFSEWVGGRLPSEAEWEYAALSAGRTTKYPWRYAPATCERAVTGECHGKNTEPVCSRLAGNSEQGLCDMAGDAWEWVEDWQHDSYSGAPNDGSAWVTPAGSQRIIRGGGWDHPSIYSRSAYRGAYEPGIERNDLGFRPVRGPR